MIQVSQHNFEKEVLQSPIPVLVDFFAPWCQPCRQLTPMLEELASEAEGIAKVVKVNVDQEMDLAAAFRVEAVPTMIVFEAGKVIERFQGVQSKSKILAALV